MFMIAKHPHYPTCIKCAEKSVTTHFALHGSKCLLFGTLCHLVLAHHCVHTTAMVLPLLLLAVGSASGIKTDYNSDCLSVGLRLPKHNVCEVAQYSTHRVTIVPRGGFLDAKPAESGAPFGWTQQRVVRVRTFLISKLFCKCTTRSCRCLLSELLDAESGSMEVQTSQLRSSNTHSHARVPRRGSYLGAMQPLLRAARTCGDLCGLLTAQLCLSSLMLTCHGLLA
jgi:hypothetical protein